MNIKLMIAVAFSTLVALPLAKAQAAEVIAGKDIIYPGTTAPMSAFMRADRNSGWNGAYRRLGSPRWPGGSKLRHRYDETHAYDRRVR